MGVDSGAINFNFEIGVSTSPCAQLGAEYGALLYMVELEEGFSPKTSAKYSTNIEKGEFLLVVHADRSDDHDD
jgi:hypothetical protein